MKKIFYLLIALAVAIVTVSCDETRIDKKSAIYAEKHKICDNKDSLYSGITVYYAKVRGHDVVYHIYDGKRKCQMEMWHFENECAKCKKAKK